VIDVACVRLIARSIVRTSGALRIGLGMKPALERRA
jgi:hypothetical protein